MVDNLKDIISDKNKTLERLVEKIKDLNETVAIKDQELNELKQGKTPYSCRNRTSAEKSMPTKDSDSKAGGPAMNKLYANIFNKNISRKDLTSGQTPSQRYSLIEKV